MRLLNQTMDRDAVFIYFEMKWLYRSSLTEQKKLLKSSLLTKYNPTYNDFLIFLKPEEFDVDNACHLGEGSFGDVYSVLWKKKRVNVDRHLEERPGPVALKIVKRQVQDSSSAQARFFEEVRIPLSSEGR
jgi:hypothetical protein